MPFQPHCGIVQGCPLSMLLLTALVTCWLEKSHTQNLCSTSRSYADDLSVLAEASTKQEVQLALNKGYFVTKRFTQLAGMTINMKKSFTFGPKSFKSSIADIADHQTNFRLVGWSIKTTKAEAWTPLERQRDANWRQTVQRIRILPISWQQAQTIQSMMPKLTFGQGMHKLHVGKEAARAMRATVIRTLFDQDHYDCAPNAVFALLTPPSIDPIFALQLSAFMLIKRTFSSNSDIDKLRLSLEQHQQVFDGPIARLKQLRDHPVFSKTIESYLSKKLHPVKWQHTLREDYRLHAWQTLCRDRSQHFAGTWAGVDRVRTLALLKELMQKADVLQEKCDKEDFIIDDPKQDPRAQLKVLRLLLTAGLQNPERQHRHKRKEGTVQCLCKKGEPSLEHLSWYCSLFDAIRKPALENLPTPLEDLPKSFLCCAIVPTNMIITQQQAIVIQKALVEIWQSHIQDWYEADENFLILPPDQPEAELIGNTPNLQTESAASSSADPVSKNGHILKISPDGGVFCQKCGKSTKFLKHQRLKILSKPCQHPNLPQAQWLQKPGAMNNQVRYEQLLQDLHTKHNQAGHKYFWNQKFGKDRHKPNTYGRLWCEACGKEWAWMQRHNNPSKRCVKPDQKFPIPQWVRDCKLDPQMLILPDLSISEIPTQQGTHFPQQRIVDKQKYQPNTSSRDSASSSSVPRTGVG